MTILSTEPRSMSRRATIDLGVPASPKINFATTNGATMSLRGGIRRIPDLPVNSLLAKFVETYEQLEAYRSDSRSIIVDGQTLSIAGVIAAARFPLQSSVSLDSSPHIKTRVDNANKALEDKVERGVSVYGVTTGFGGSADTRTDQTHVLGKALLEMQNCGVLTIPSHISHNSSSILPLSDPLSSTSMPESWVRGAILIRMNSLIRGHSGVRWELIERMGMLLEKNITPVVPLRGSISASGDLSPLSYIAGAVIGNPSVRVFYTPPSSPSPESSRREIVPSSTAYNALSVSPLPFLSPKEPLGILNGTAFSSSVGILAMWDSVQMILGGVICTALGVEAMGGSRGNFVPFIHKVARPHAGQVECGSLITYLLEDSAFAIPPAQDDERAGEVHINEDSGTLKQDRYPLRTAPQFLGPQLEDALSSWAALTVECNSTTDNPLVEVTQAPYGCTPKAKIHNGGNFQAMSVTNAMEKTRLSLHHVGKILFAQCAEMVDTKANRGLPPNLALGDPSLDYCMKGVDISSAAYVSELGYLANPVSTHIQSAEMHNQAVNSLALISARATINSLEVLGILMSSYLYVLCQALDLRALQKDLYETLENVIREEVISTFRVETSISDANLATIIPGMFRAMRYSLDKTSGMDAEPRMKKVAKETVTVIIDWVLATIPLSLSPLTLVPSLSSRLAARFTEELCVLRHSYVKGEKSAGDYLGRTKVVYDWVRKTQGVKMRAWPGYQTEGVVDSIGENISRIYEGVRDGGLQTIIVQLFGAIP